MNDDFIYKSLPKVRKEFEESLSAKLSTDAVLFSQPKPDQKLRRRRWLQAALIVLGVFLLVAWSQIRLWIRYVPIGDLFLVELSQSTEAAPTVPQSIPTPGQLPTEIIDGIEGELWLLDYLSPTWIPQDFYAAEPPRIMISYEETLGFWSNDAQQKIRLFAVPREGGMNPYAPVGMYEEVQVNGEPAVLIHGRFALTKPDNPTANREWDETLGLQLSWSWGESVYTLETFGKYLSESDLIRMAESMKSDTPWISTTPTP